MNLDCLTLVVSIFSALIAVCALFLAKKANRIAQEANGLTKHYNLRPMRLDACNLLQEFAHYCTTYRTRFLQKIVLGTNELMDHRDHFKSEFETFGPLGMPDVEAKATEFINMAVQLQRALDRSRGSDPKPLDSKYETLVENTDAIVDWFVQEEKELPSLLRKYLGDA